VALEALDRQSQVRHDLRAPLAVMYPLLSLMLADGGFTARQREQLETLERAVHRLDGVIASVADSGWFDCCGSPVHVVPVSPGELIEEYAARQLLRGYDGPALEARVAPDVPAARADRARLAQILDDLVDNAARFAGPDGPVGLAVEPAPAEQTVVISVTDRGPGIPADELSHVTEFGYRGSAARETGVPGLGLGLWVCRGLADSMGAALAVESAAGAGTTVRITLPAAPGELSGDVE
jgi:signal transduction histidine kinase